MNEDVMECPKCKDKKIRQNLSQSELDDLLCAIAYLDKFVPPWAKAVIPNLNPMFYGTGTYEGDKEVQEKVEKIKKLISKYSR